MPTQEMYVSSAETPQQKRARILRERNADEQDLREIAGIYHRYNDWEKPLREKETDYFRFLKEQLRLIREVMDETRIMRAALFSIDGAVIHIKGKWTIEGHAVEKIYQVYANKAKVSWNIETPIEVNDILNQIKIGDEILVQGKKTGDKIVAWSVYIGKLPRGLPHITLPQARYRLLPPEILEIHSRTHGKSLKAHSRTGALTSEILSDIGTMSQHKKWLSDLERNGRYELLQIIRSEDIAKTAPIVMPAAPTRGEILVMTASQINEEGQRQLKQQRADHAEFLEEPSRPKTVEMDFFKEVGGAFGTSYGIKRKPRTKARKMREV